MRVTTVRCLVVSLACVGLLVGCTAPRQAPALISAPTPAASIAPADVSGTVTAAVQATLQADAPTKLTNSNQPSSISTIGAPLPSIAVDDVFTKLPQGWPNTIGGPARYADGVYRLAPQGNGQFVALNTPLITSLHDVTLSGRFHKSGGPVGGGYGLIVHDQGPDIHDGISQTGRFVVLEVGDEGTVGIWQREHDHWTDLLARVPNGSVHTGIGT